LGHCDITGGRGGSNRSSSDASSGSSSVSGISSGDFDSSGGSWWCWRCSSVLHEWTVQDVVGNLLTAARL
jgi:hypothetical protein